VKKVLLAVSAVSFLGVFPLLGDSAVVGVSATVVPTCTVTTSAGAFGDYDPLAAKKSAALNASGAVAIACTRGAAPSVGLGPGVNGDGSARGMRGAGPGVVTYELFKPSSTSPGAVEDRVPRAYRIRGQAGVGQSPSAGRYTDTVVVTLNF